MSHLPSTPTPLIAAVQAALEDFLAEQAEAVAAVGPEFSHAVEVLRNFVLDGGKRVRPTVAYAGWLAMTERQLSDPADAHLTGAANATESESGNTTRTDDQLPPTAVIRALASLELVQACALMHDDIIDNSTTRRGHPSTHVRCEAYHRTKQWQSDAEDYGRGVAILLGDLALAWADDLFHSSGLSPKLLAAAQPFWGAMRTEVLGGQLLDLTAEASRATDRDTAERINRSKTASYTVVRPLHLGAALAGATDEDIDALTSYGLAVGVAFQLRDDLLGVFGDPEVTGKPSGDDLRSGKRTELLATALEALDSRAPDEAARLRDAVGTPLTNDDVVELRQLIVASGAAEASEQRIAVLRTEAQTIARASGFSDAGARLLESLADDLTTRSR